MDSGPDGAITVQPGSVTLRQVELDPPSGADRANATVVGPEGAAIALARVTGGRLVVDLERDLTIQADGELAISAQW